MKIYMETFKEFIFSKMVRNVIILFLFRFSTELIVRLVTDTFIGYGLLRIGLSSFIFSLLISLISSYFGKVISKIIKIIFCIIVTIYTFVEVGLYNYIGFYMGIGNSEQGAKTLSYIGDLIKSLKPIYYLLFIPLVLIILYYCLLDKRLLRFEEKKKSKRVGIKKIVPTIVTIVLIGLFSVLYYTTLVIPSMQN